jgi:hypothetical protein
MISHSLLKKALQNARNLFFWIWCVTLVPGNRLVLGALEIRTNVEAVRGSRCSWVVLPGISVPGTLQTLARVQ